MLLINVFVLILLSDNLNWNLHFLVDLAQQDNLWIKMIQLNVHAPQHKYLIKIRVDVDAH